MPGTTFKPEKLTTLADIAAYLAMNWDALDDPQIAREMLREGLRKLHDHATFGRGKGKFLGHPNWSKDALHILRKSDLKINEAKSQLRHEHVVPVDDVVRMLIAQGKAATKESCQEIIQKFSLVAIITRDEDRLLTRSNNALESWDSADLWSRYKAIELYENMTTLQDADILPRE
jgi:hypothetical protein